MSVEDLTTYLLLLHRQTKKARYLYLKVLGKSRVGGAFVAELWFPFQASLAVLVQILRVYRVVVMNGRKERKLVWFQSKDSLPTHSSGWRTWMKKRKKWYKIRERRERERGWYGGIFFFFLWKWYSTGFYSTIKLMALLISISRVQKVPA